MTYQEFSNQLEEIRSNLAMTREMLDNQTIMNPVRTYAPEELIDLVDRPAPRQRQAIPFINVPGPGQTWQQLNQWRVAYGLAPVTR